MVEIPVTGPDEPEETPSSGDEGRRTGADAPGAGAPLDEEPTVEEVMEGVDRPVLLFDGVCNLCNWSVRTVVRLDGEGRVLFAPLQSEVGSALLERVGMDPDYFDSVVLVDGEDYYTKSAAVLRVCRYLDGPLPLLSVLRYLPAGLRDTVYDLVAEYRYDVFGRQDACPVPDERTRRRYLDRSLA